MTLRHRESVRPHRSPAEEPLTNAVADFFDDLDVGFQRS